MGYRSVSVLLNNFTLNRKGIRDEDLLGELKRYAVRKNGLRARVRTRIAALQHLAYRKPELEARVEPGELFRANVRPQCDAQELG